MAETINYGVVHNAVVLVGHRSANGAVLYQRGAKPHDNGHLDIIFHNSRAESPDYHSNVFVYFVCFVVGTVSSQAHWPRILIGKNLCVSWSGRALRVGAWAE